MKSIMKQIIDKKAAEEAVDERERAVLVAVVRDNQEPRQAEEFLDELEFLAETADIVTVIVLRNDCPSPHHAYMSDRVNSRR